MTKQQILELKMEIDKIREYVHSELCKKCEEMSQKLKECEQIIQRASSEQ